MEPELDGTIYDCGALGQFVLIGPEESARRANLVLPGGPSVDARHIIESKLSPDTLKPASDDDGDEDCSPCSHINFVIEAELEISLPSNCVQLEALEKLDWSCRPDMYVFESHRQKWTYMSHQHEDEEVTAIKFAWPLVDENYDSDTEEWHFSALAKEEMKVLLGETKTIVLSIDPSANIFTNGQVRDSAHWAGDLVKLKAEFDGTVALRLVAKDKWFEGKKVWDTLVSLGIEWGDCDEFHLHNPSNKGDDHFFSVGTSTAPGYFLPEDINDGEIYYEDLQFYFNIARSISPLETYDAMRAAAEYTQQQLGGTIVVTDQDNPDIAWIPEYIEDTVAYLNDCGFVPGESAAMLFF